MTVEQLALKCSFKVICMPDGNRDINGCYMGDLLSWVMGRAKADNAWITIMSNANIAAVASLADVSCVVLAEGVEIDGDLIAVCEQKEINVLTSPTAQYETAISIYKALQE